MKTATPVTGAFLAVAFADGRYDPAEEHRFLATIANHAALKLVRTEALEAAYNALVGEFEADYVAATARVIDSIVAVKGDPAIVEAVKVAARGAVVADARVAPQEEIMLDRIAEALGLGKGAV